ncbi:MAG: helix-turn-helix transcriptional regulator [Bacteroidales bacterium]
MLLIILVVSYLAHNKTLKKRNRILCRQIEAQTRAREELITLKESLHEIQINNQESDLFNRLEKLMKQHRLYAQTDLTRENLAEKLNTNRTYLTDAIKGKTGMSYSEYITELRLQNALMLFEKQPDLSITVVSEEVGYASYTSFYRAFSKRYGINPGEYHKFIQEQA